MVLVNGALQILFNLLRVVNFPILSIWNITWGVIEILIAIAVIKPKFSDKCASQDWDALYGWVLKLGSFKLPWMLVWGIIFEMFGWLAWGGLPVLIPAIMLLFVGPKPYEWTEE